MAKYCGKCGTQLSEQEKFCMKCGTPVSNTKVEKKITPKIKKIAKPKIKTKKEKKPMSKGKKAKIVIISVLISISAIIITFGALYLTGSAFAVYRDMNAQKYEDAVKEFQSGVENDLIQKVFLEIELKDYAQKIYNDYYNQKIEFNDATNALRALVKMGFEGTNELADKITTINAEREAIEAGNKYYADKDYINAVKEYSKIDKKSENYDSIATNFSDALVQYKNTVISDVDKLSKSSDYENIISILDEAKNILSDEEIEKMFHQYVSLFEEKCISESKSLFDKKDYDRAISTLEHGLKVLPDSKVISDELEKQVGSKPIKLTDTNILYDGVCYSVFKPDSGESFQIGSKTYYEGFEIWDDHSLFGEGDGYALFDLQGEYSEISFDVGRTNEYEMEDVVLKVYLNDKFVEEYSLSAQSSLKNITINLAYAKNMKIEITGGSRVKYGFVNIYLKK